MSPPILEVKDLIVEFPQRRGILRALDGVSLRVGPGEILGLVGESGAGKSMTGSAVIGLLDPPGRIASGEVWVRGQRIDGLTEDEMRQVRGKEIGAVFQDPLTALNPLYTVGQQLIETIQTHLGFSAAQARQEAIALLVETGIPAAEQRIDQYPHQFSGGMRQRVVIALALCARPQLVVADEPTTALDVSIQAQIIGLLKRVCKERGAAVLLITHDMGVIAETCDRVAVMYSGRVVEEGPVAQVIQAPRHPYTAGLMAAIPDIDQETHRLAHIPGSMPRLDALPLGCGFHPRCAFADDQCRSSRPPLTDLGGKTAAACWHLDALNQEKKPASASSQPFMVRPASTVELDPARPLAPLVEVHGLSRTFDVSDPWLSRMLSGGKRHHLRAVQEVSLSIPKGKTFALVGESGCGKSTMARMLVGLDHPTQGEVRFDGQPLHSALASAQSMALRRRLQMIFQDPFASLNPRWTVGDIVAEPLLEHRLVGSRRELTAQVGDLLASVGLSAKDQQKYPHQFSGGQRQRISIARALATQPEFLVCDEPTSALDVSVQAQVLNLMQDLQRDRGLTYLFISHNLAIVRHLSDEVAVMYLGRIVEKGSTKKIFAAPRHPYTRLLMDAIPRTSGTNRDRAPIQGEVPNPLAPPAGCAFHPRCPHANARCSAERPVLQTIGGIRVACHAVEEGRI